MAGGGRKKHPVANLRGAAQFWAERVRGGRGKDELRDALEFYGVEDIEALVGEDPEEFEVLPENWEATQAFLALQTQWTHGALGGWLGLSYPAVESVLRMLGTRNRREVFDQIRVMELAALPVLNEKAK